MDMTRVAIPMNPTMGTGFTYKDFLVPTFCCCPSCCGEFMTPWFRAADDASVADDADDAVCCFLFLSLASFL